MAAENSHIAALEGEVGRIVVVNSPEADIPGEGDTLGEDTLAAA